MIGSVCRPGARNIWVVRQTSKCAELLWGRGEDWEPAAKMYAPGPQKNLIDNDLGAFWDNINKVPTD